MADPKPINEQVIRVKPGMSFELRGLGPVTVTDATGDAVQLPTEDGTRTITVDDRGEIMIDQKNGPVEFTPADMPRDNAGNTAYKHGNFFQSKGHSDGLPKPHHAHEPTSWASMIVDPDILSQPAPNWQHPSGRYGLVGRLHSGPYHELGYQGHCHACRGYFLNYKWAQDHECREEAAFRDVTRREIRDYPSLRKAAKHSPAAPVLKGEKGIVARLLGMFGGR